MFQNFVNNIRALIARGDVSVKLLDTDYIGMMSKDPATNGGHKPSVISGKSLKAEIASIAKAEASTTAGTSITELVGSSKKLTRVLTESELDNLGTGFELLPAVANTYYDVNKIRVIWNINGATITYNTTVDNYFAFYRNNGTRDLAFLDGNVINNTESKVASTVIPNHWHDSTNDLNIGIAAPVNQNITVYLYNATNPTKGGAGSVIPTCTIEMYYDEIVF